MKNYTWYIYAIILMWFVSGCRKEVKKSDNEFNDRMITEQNKPFAIGEEYVLYVVSESANNETLINYCDSFFCKYIYGLPQRECLIFPVQLSVSGLNETRLKNLSILFLHNRQNDSAMHIFIRKNFPEFADIKGDTVIVKNYIHKWAYPQAVGFISAPDEKTLLQVLTRQSVPLLAFYDKYERMRTKRVVYAKGSNSTQNNAVLNAFRVSLSVPSGYLNIFQRLKGYQDKTLRALNIGALLWYRLKNESFSSDFMIYSLPYQENLNENSILEIRNQISKHLVHGPNKNSYVAVAESFYPPASESVVVNGFPGLKIVGLWETIGDWMGGPFIMYVLKDKKNNQLLVFDGFVYAPGMDKAPLIRRLDIIANTIRKTE